MAYDLMNRRENVAQHHTDVIGSAKSIDRYLCLGLAPQKINLGFAFYAKWFKTDPQANCVANPLGCPIATFETADGSDTGNSGVITFENRLMAQPKQRLTVSSTGTCGLAAGKSCPAGSCCSADGFWYVVFLLVNFHPIRIRTCDG